mgnify:CR=1 FL=1
MESMQLEDIPFNEQSDTVTFQHLFLRQMKWKSYTKPVPVHAEFVVGVFPPPLFWSYSSPVSADDGRTVPPPPSYLFLQAVQCGSSSEMRNYLTVAVRKDERVKEANEKQKEVEKQSMGDGFIPNESLCDCRLYRFTVPSPLWGGNYFVFSRGVLPGRRIECQAASTALEPHHHFC